MNKSYIFIFRNSKLFVYKFKLGTIFAQHVLLKTVMDAIFVARRKARIRVIERLIEKIEQMTGFSIDNDTRSYEITRLKASVDVLESEINAFQC